MTRVSRISGILLTLLLSLFARQVTAQDFQRLKTSEGEIAYRIFGQGAPLFLLNGGPGRSSDTFEGLAQKLSSFSRQVIVFDQRGTGRSRLLRVDESSVTLEKMVEDLEALRRHLKIEKVVLMGHSFGGLYSMAYAARYPQNVGALILSAPGGMDLDFTRYIEANMLTRLDPEARRKYASWNSPELRRKDPTKAALEKLRLSAPAYVYDQRHVPEVEARLVDLRFYFPEVNRLVWKNLSDSAFDLKGKFQNFHAPGLLLAGRQDFLGDEVPLTIARQIPGMHLVFLNQASHYLWLDQPARYFKEIESFLRAH